MKFWRLKARNVFIHSIDRVEAAALCRRACERKKNCQGLTRSSLVRLRCNVRLQKWVQKHGTFARSTSRVHLWRRRGARAVVRQLWAASLGPWHRGSIIRHRRSKRHRRVIRACHPAAMSRRSRPRHTATCHTRGPLW